MSRTPAVAAMVLSLTLGLICGAATSVQAQTSARTAPQNAAPAVEQRRSASTQERAAADRQDALTRSVFWSREMDLNQADPVAGVKMAQALRELGQYDQAAAVAQQILVIQPANIEAMLELGRAHIARGQAFYGVAALEQARALAPQDWRPLSLLGVAYQQVRRADDARAAWNDGLKLAPNNPEILTNAAIALTAEGNAAGAEVLLRRAVAQPGATLKMRQNLALVLGLQGRTGEAEQIIRRDLPPEQAEHNLQWLRAATTQQAGTAVAATAGGVQPAPASVLGASPSTARTWTSLQGG